MEFKTPKFYEVINSHRTYYSEVYLKDECFILTIEYKRLFSFHNNLRLTIL